MAIQHRVQKRKRNRTWAILIVIVLFLVIGMGLAIHNLSDKAASYAAREAELESMIAEEEGRSYEYQEESKLRQTLKYIEMLAREKLGLVYPNEVVVKPSE